MNKKFSGWLLTTGLTSYYRFQFPLVAVRGLLCLGRVHYLLFSFFQSSEAGVGSEDSRSSKFG